MHGVKVIPLKPIGSGKEEARGAEAPQFLLSLHRNVIFLHMS